MPAWSNGCDTIERFDVFTHSIKLNCGAREIETERRVISFAFLLGLLSADVVTFRVPGLCCKDKKKSGKLISPGSTSQISKKPHNTTKEEFALDDIKSMLNWVFIILLFVIVL